MAQNNLTIATSQFPVSTNIHINKDYITKQIHEAAKLRADVIHFPELSLSGYENEAKDIDWQFLHHTVEELKELANKLKIYLIFGIHEQNIKGEVPYNCTYLITDKGELAGKYIKANVYNKEIGRFEPQDNFFTYLIKGINCGFLICYDSCFPELFQNYRDLGVKLLFLSYYNAKSSKRKKNSMNTLMSAQLVTRATDNMMYISGSNSSAFYSRMPSSFVAPDGTLSSLKRHVAGILISSYPHPNLGWTYDNSQ